MSTAHAAEREGETITGFRRAPAQAALWRRQRGGRVFLALARARVVGDLDVTRLAEALAAVFARNDILRATFRQLPGMDVPLQVMEGGLPPRVDEVDWCGRDCAALQDELLAKLPTAFDWRNGPLLHVALARVSAREQFLFLAASSLIADAESLRSIMGELAAAVNAADPAPTADVQFLHYSEWSHDAREGDAAEVGRKFWDDLGDFAGTRLALPLEGAARIAVVGVVEATGPVASAAAVLAGWAAVLGRQVQKREVVICTRWPGRPFDELRGVIGPFAEFLPLRLRWEDDDTVGAIADRVDGQLAAYGDYLPHADRARRALDAPQFGFAHEAEQPDQPQGATSFVDIDASDDLADWDLLLRCQVSGERLRLTLRFDAGRHDRQLVQGLVDSLAATLNGLERTTPMGRLAVLGGREFAQVVHKWNDECVGPLQETCIHTAFETVAALQPETLAVVAPEASYTYAALDARSNQLARALHRVGVTPGTRVAIALQRCADLVTAVLGVLKAGSTCVPLDPESPGRRLTMLLIQADVGAVVSSAAASDNLGNPAVPVVLLGDELLAGEAATAPVVPCTPSDPAYMIFTSGSTGTPKAVVVEHRSAVNLARALQAQVYEAFHRTVNLTLNAPLSFDASVKQIVQLLNGHCLHVVPEDGRRDGATLLALLRAQRIDALDCTPSHLKLLMSAGFADHTSEWPSVVLVGGESIDRNTWALLARHRATFYNVYGPTETTVNASIARITPGSAPNIGRPILNARIYVLDEALRPLPIGVAGELCIGGRGVARGYFRSPEQTELRFRADPFVKGARLYRSGDAGRFLPDGSIEFLGRIDDQVKIRGFRIEPGEIVAALREHPAVADAVVLGLGEAGDTRLVAYVASADGNGLDADHFKANLAQLNQNETTYLYDEIFEKQTYIRHGIQLADDACVFDVGANIGMFSMYIARRCRRPRLYAFEPLAPIFDRLEANLARHGPAAKRFAFGLSAGERTESFTYYPGYSMMSGQEAYADPAAEVQVIKTFLRNEQAGDADAGLLLEHADELLAERFRAERHVCRLRRLSDVIREEGVERIDLLKIDVQRAERDVLVGIDDADWLRIAQIVMEVHDCTGTATEGRVGDLLDLLEGKGYEVHVEQDDLLRGTDRYNLYAFRPTYAASVAVHRAEPAVASMPTVAELSAFLAERLPDYMIPASYVVIPKIPLTRNGKVDRAALPAPDARRPALGHAAEQPDCWQERVLVKVWGEVLGLDEVGVEDNFFQLGGDSIRSIQVQALAKTRGLHFPLHALFTFQTIRKLVRGTDLAQMASPAAVGVPFELLRNVDRVRMPADAEDAYPLSTLQAGMIYHTELTGEASTYHNVSSHCIGAPLDATILRRAVDALVAAHPLLRTSFHLYTFSEPLQIVHRTAHAMLDIAELSHMSTDDQWRIVDEDARVELQRPFDWETAPLVRFRAHRLSDHDFILTIAEYHAILDGWSLHLVLTELCQRYSLLLGRNTSLSLAPTALTYRRFLDLERQARNTPETRTFWSRALDGAPRARLPRGECAERSVSRRTDACGIELSRGLSDGLWELSRNAGIPLKSILLAAHVRVIGAASRVDDVVTGLVTNGRPEEAGGDRVVGLFINTLPFRLGFDDGSWLDLARRAFVAESALVQHRWMPVGEIQRMYAGGPLFESFFNFSHFHALPGGGADASVPILASRTHPADIDLPLAVDFEIEPATSAVKLYLQYDAREFGAPQMVRLGASYRRALEAFVTGPHTPCMKVWLGSDSADSAVATDLVSTATIPTETLFTEPQTPLEAQLACIWAEVLGVQRVGRDDDFRALGGHSLLATQVVARIRRETGRRLSLASFCCRQTISGLARALAAIDDGRGV